MALQIPRLRIPVFVSCPSNLSPQQEASAQIIFKLIERYKLEWRALGRSDYPHKLPLREVLRMIRHCSGGIVLGFEQFWAPKGVFKRGSKKQEVANKPVMMPTPWNQLEAGILFNQNLPIMIFSESGIEGGVFDKGITDVFIHKMPTPRISKSALDDLDTVFQTWASEVKTNYYRD